MTASQQTKKEGLKNLAQQQAKKEGFKNLAQVSRLSGVSAVTLKNWHRDKPRLFSITLKGCLVTLEKNSNYDSAITASGELRVGDLDISIFGENAVLFMRADGEGLAVSNRNLYDLLSNYYDERF